jgi:hypothetical protein
VAGLDLAVDRAALERQRDRSVTAALPLDAGVGLRDDDGFVADGELRDAIDRRHHTRRR